MDFFFGKESGQRTRCAALIDRKTCLTRFHQWKRIPCSVDGFVLVRAVKRCCDGPMSLVLNACSFVLLLYPFDRWLCT